MGYSSRINAKTKQNKQENNTFFIHRLQCAEHTGRVELSGRELYTQVGVKFSGRELYTQVGV